MPSLAKPCVTCSMKSEVSGAPAPCEKTNKGPFSGPSKTSSIGVFNKIIPKMGKDKYE